MALTSDKRRETDGVAIQTIPLPVAGSTTIYAGSMVCANTDGYMVPAADTSGFVFMGVSTEEVDNSDGSDGDVSVVLEHGHLEKVDADENLVQANVGKNVFADDDETVADDNEVTNSVKIGTLERLDSDGAWVRMRAFADADADNTP